MISRITIFILSWVSMCTSAGDPLIKATRRFWIRVESLKRPPTLLTISSSRSSSSMREASALCQDIADLFDRVVQIVIDDLVPIPVGQSQFAPSPSQPLLDGPLILRPSPAEPLLQDLEGTGPNENGDRLWEAVHDRLCPV